MGDIRGRLKVLDNAAASDVWLEAETRVPGEEPGAPGRRKGITIVVGLTLAAVSLGFVIRALGGSSGGSSVGDASGNLYEASGMVLEDESHGPELCLGAIATSLPPPQCGGLPITNWDWERVEGEEQQGNARWGAFHVVGTYDGKSFTLTETPGPPEYAPGPSDENPIETPCPEPEGGWQPPDPSRVADDDLQAAYAAARAEPDFAGLWIGRIGKPTEGEARISDGVVLNIAFTGDLGRHEAETRQLWGGPLCMVRHERTYDELRRIQTELSGGAADELGLRVLSSGVDQSANRVDVDVLVIDEATMEALDARFGTGAVRVRSALHPLTP